MTKNFILRFVFAGVVALSVLFSPARAQVVTAGMTGVVRDNNGKAISGADVSAVHVPTGTTYTATTTAEGRYYFRGMIAGGPFTITAKANGYKVSERTDVETQLTADIDVPITMEPSEVVTMDKYVVQGQSNALDSSAAGAASILNSMRLASKPTTARSLADLVSASPFVTLRSTFGDREESQITALGQNNRYNSIQIDGSRINDQFGLNGTGLASFFNPISIDTLEQLSVQVSPYDVRQAGFTGASINAVTKSGTNAFHGSAYYYFSGDHFGKIQLQGEDVSTKINTGVKNVPKLERITQGFTLGGPLWKDHIFFFINYEKLVRSAPPSDPGMLSVDATQLASIKAAFAKYNADSGQKIAWGELGGAALNVTREKKYLGKLDWNITKNHRATVRYSSTQGELPQFGSFVSTTRTNSSAVPTLTANGVTALDSNFYSQVRQERNVTAQIFSQWTPDFKTELKWGTVDQPQSTPTAVNAPEVTIFGVTGVTKAGAPTTGGAIVAGTDVNRQPNYNDSKIKQLSAVADYFYRDFVFTGGVEREATEFINVFRTGSYGVLTFASVNDFIADIPARIDRAGYDPALRSASDLSDFATTGIFGQVKWNVNPRLNLTAGVRYEMMETKKKPALFQALLTDTGFKNNGTMDGNDMISPRVSANWAVDPERTIQVRGGVGHFLGRAPWVLFSNSYNKLGVGDFTLLGQNNPGQGTFTNYLKAFDPANPIGVGTDNPTLRREVDFADNKIKLPAVWRANLGVDRKLTFLNSTLTAEIIYTRIDEALFITNENIRATTVGADGRQRFAGNPSTVANARYSRFTDLYHIQNVSVGESTYITVEWNRPMKNHWTFDASYTRGKSTEAQAIGQTTASGQWQRNVVFNQGVVENGTSDFQVKDRILVTFAREFEFIKTYKTLLSLNYEGRTGNPFSWIYANDLNGDGQSNDTVAVPSSLSDPRFDFSAMSASDQQKYMDFIQARGLARYAGGVAPKNAFVQPFVNKLDLMISQSIPLHFKSAQLEAFLVWTNFGSFIDRHLFNYYEDARTTNDVFRREFIGQATYGTDGRIRPTFNPDAFSYDNGQSRWKIQLGARLKF